MEKWLVGTALEILKRGAKQASLSEITLSVTHDCNQHCLTCNIWKKYKRDPQARNQELSIEEFDALFAASTQPMWISFTGGEPFCRIDFLHIVLSALQNVRTLRLISINTNGSMPERIERDICQILDFRGRREILVLLNISLNGPEELHDTVSGTVGSHKKALETFRRLYEKENHYRLFRTHFEYTISKFNGGMFQATLEGLSRQGISLPLDRYTIAIAQQSPYYNLPAQKRVSPESASCLQELEYILKSHPRIAPIPYLYLKGAVEYVRRSGMRHPCSATTHSCLIDPYGKVYPCIFMHRELGTLREHNFKLNEILSLETWKNSPKRCEGCWTPCEIYPSIMFRHWDLLKFWLMERAKSIKKQDNR